MPKQVYNIQQFHGGLNSSSDPRDIAENELASSIDIVVDEVGKIRMMGGSVSHDASAAEITNFNIKPGYGMFAYSTDRNAAGADTGEDWLLFADKTASNGIHFYGRVTDNEDFTGKLKMGTGSNVKHCFYSVDGALRVSDGNFGTNNDNLWFAYIDKEFFKSCSGDSIIADTWKEYSQKISKPSAVSVFDNAIESAGTTYDQDYVLGGGSGAVNTDTVKFSTDAILSTAGTTNVSKIVVSVHAEAEDNEDNDLMYTIKVGDATNSTTFGTPTKEQYVNTSVGKSTEYDVTHTFTFDASTDFVGTGSTAGVRVYLQDTGNGGDISEFAIVTATAYKGTEIGGAHSELTTSSVNFEILAGGSDGKGWDKDWNVGCSFIYDGNQESLIRELLDEDSDSDTLAALGAAEHPQIKLNLAYTIQDATCDFDDDPTIDHDDDDGAIKVGMNVSGHSGIPTGAYVASVTSDTRFELSVSTTGGAVTDATLIFSQWSDRITGINLYMRESSDITTKSWYLQTTYDLIAGTGKSYPNGVPTNFLFDPIINEYTCVILRAKLKEPNLVDSYEIVSGISATEESIISKFKTAVVNNRVAYIGGLENVKEDGTKEIKSDAMIKSLVNKFDTFPSKRIVEASIRDGDAIVKLEEYADRILQFKKKKMHLINVSQEIEFLEETFMHKGIDHPAAACKTDFGIAWVNKHGCYLYNGRQVTNLLEKGGRQIIKESDWSSFITDFNTSSTSSSMIGYVPLRRQLIIVKDVTATGSDNDDIYIFDLVTQSWARGDLSGSGDQSKTNFVNDWNGDLVFSDTTGFGVPFKWSDTANSSTLTLSIKTKDIDFGSPGVRKKVHKVYLSYKGDGTSVLIQYSVNGDTDTVHQFFRCNADGTSEGSTTDVSPLHTNPGTDDWVRAELKPDVSSESNNIFSFQLVMTGGAAADFEINDISIIYRMKHIK